MTTAIPDGHRVEPEAIPASPNLLWLVWFRFSFSYAASKNRLYLRRRDGKVVMRHQSRNCRDEIAGVIRESGITDRIVHNKVWLDLLVHKPNHRGDAVNVVDLVCDAVKGAIGVDDRWFCIRRLDWQVCRDQPQLFIGIGQESEEPAQVCSTCGEIRQLSWFAPAKSDPLGVGRKCRDCRKPHPRAGNH